MGLSWVIGQIEENKGTNLVSLAEKDVSDNRVKLDQGSRGISGELRSVLDQKEVVQSG